MQPHQSDSRATMRHVYLFHGLDPEFCGPAQHTDGLSSDPIPRWL